MIMKTTKSTLLFSIYLICSLHVITSTNSMNKLRKMKSQTYLSIFSKDYSKNLDPNSTDDGLKALTDNAQQIRKMLQDLKKDYENKPKDTNYSKLVNTLESTIKGAEAQIKEITDFKDKQDKQFTQAKNEIQANQDKLAQAKSKKFAAKSTWVVGKSFAAKATMGNAENTRNAISGCMAGALAAVPPSFCMKKGADFGIIPTVCPNGYFRSLALCYQYCRPGYDFVLGVCWEQCRSGFTNMGLTCFKWAWFNSQSYGRSTYMSDSVTNFSSRVNCEPGMYKGGALCYRDCANIGLVNCGIGACSSDTLSCVSGIGTMVLEFALSLYQAVGFVASFGTSGSATAGISAAKAAIIKGFKSLSASAIKSGLSTVKRFATTAGLRALLKKQTLAATKKSMKDAAFTYLGPALVQNICSNVVDKLLDSSKPIGSNIDLTAFDPTGISGAVEACKGAGSNASANDNAACAKGVISSLGTFDPTGIMGMVAALIVSTCDVPSSPPTE